MATGLPAEHVEDVDQGNAAKGEVAPLVAGADKSAGETGDNHDLVNEDDEEDRGPGHAGSEEQVCEQQRGGNDPVDVPWAELVSGGHNMTDERYTPHVEDLTVETANLRIVTDELDGNAGPAKVGSHGEVGNGGDHGDHGGDVVEDTVLTRLGERKAHECHGRSDHDSSHSPVPVGTVSGNGDLSVSIVYSVTWA